MMKLRLIGFTVASILTIGSVCASQIESPNVTSLISEADLVFVGELEPSAPSQLSSIHVSRIIKGRAQSDTVRVKGVSFGAGTCMFLLKFNNDGTYSNLNDESPIVASENKFGGFQGAYTAPLDEAVGYLVDVFTMTPEHLVQSEAGLQRGLSNGLVESGEQFRSSGAGYISWERPTQLRIAENLYNNVAESLSDFPASYTASALKALIDRDPVSLGAIYANIALLKAGDFSQVRQARDYLLKANADLKATSEAFYLAFTQFPAPPELLDFSVALSKSRDDKVRQAAIYQLKLSAQPVAQAILKRALLDPMRNVRKEAVWGVCTPDVCGAKPDYDLLSSREAAASIYHRLANGG